MCRIGQNLQEILIDTTESSRINVEKLIVGSLMIFQVPTNASMQIMKSNSAPSEMITHKMTYLKV